MLSLCCKLYHKPTRFETIGSGRILYQNLGCKLYHKPTRFETACQIFYTPRDELQIIPQTNSVWNLFRSISCNTLAKVANYTTNQLGLKLLLFKYLWISAWVANYTTNQLGLKPTSIISSSLSFLLQIIPQTNSVWNTISQPVALLSWMLQIIPQTNSVWNPLYVVTVEPLLSCKLYHKLTRFETNKRLYFYKVEVMLQIIPQTNSIWNYKLLISYFILCLDANYTTN